MKAAPKANQRYARKTMETFAGKDDNKAVESAHKTTETGKPRRFVSENNDRLVK